MLLRRVLPPTLSGEKAYGWTLCAALPYVTIAQGGVGRS
jgi:hypothetical protein